SARPRRARASSRRERGTGAARGGNRASVAASPRRTTRSGGSTGSRSRRRTRRAGCSPWAGRTASAARAAPPSTPSAGRVSRVAARGELAEQLLQTPGLLVQLVQRPAAGLREREDLGPQVGTAVGGEREGDAAVAARARHGHVARAGAGSPAPARRAGGSPSTARRSAGRTRLRSPSP